MPDESLFKKHLEEALFQIGVDANQWSLSGDIQWPHAIIWCAATPNGIGESKYFFRFNLENYPSMAPTSVPWDMSGNQKLANDKWPNWSQMLKKVFNPGWNNGNALYSPCDRMAMRGHDQWKNQHPAYWWTSESTIVIYLRFLFQILNTSER